MDFDAKARELCGHMAPPPSGNIGGRVQTLSAALREAYEAGVTASADLVSQQAATAARDGEPDHAAVLHVAAEVARMASSKHPVKQATESKP